MKRGESFAIETTLGGRSHAWMIPRWKQAGYQVGNWIQQADQAVIRAAARAKALAASTRTPIHIMRDGKVVKIMPEQEDPHPSPAKRPA